MPPCLIKHLRIETNMKFHDHKAHPLHPKICNYFAVSNTLHLQRGLHLWQVFSCEVFTVFAQIQHINTKLCLILFEKQVLLQHSILLWWWRKTNLLSHFKHLVYLYHTFYTLDHVLVQTWSLCTLAVSRETEIETRRCLCTLRCMLGNNQL